jgi:hypothetical protein
MNNNPVSNEITLKQKITGSEKPFLIDLVNNKRINKTKDTYKVVFEPYQIMILK